MTACVTQRKLPSIALPPLTLRLLRSYWCADRLRTSIVRSDTAAAAQILAVHLLRTEKIPFIQSRAAWPLMASSFAMMGVGVALCYIPGLNRALSLTAIVPGYYAWLAGILLLYSATVQLIKVLYIRVFNTWL